MSGRHAGKGLQGRVEKVCLNCGDTFSGFPSQVGKYCSTSCAGAARRVRPSPALIKRNSIPEPNSGCWLWTGACTGCGYGAIQCSNVMHLAHRLSYSVFHGRLANSDVVRHRCDNACCVNPSHLEIGTHADNVRDAVKRNRVDFGSKRYNAKLSELDIPKIRKLLESGRSCESIGRAFGVSGRAIGLIRDHQRWVRA